MLLAVSENNQIQTFSAGSLTKTEHNRPYYIYSITKTFTAVAILKLCQRHGNFLDESVSSFLPAASITADITVRQLLNHTSGLGDYFTSAIYQEAVKATPAQPWSYSKLMRFGLSKGPVFHPGKSWAYSNPGYGLLKELIEAKSGMSYYDYLDKVIIKPCGLNETNPFVRPDTELRLLEGEDDQFSGDFRLDYHPGWIATGCLISTVSDIARFYDALFDEQIIHIASLEEITQTVEVLAESPAENIPSYGLGLMHFKKSPLGIAYGHGGSGPGYTTYALHYPDLNGNSLSISMVLNRRLPQTPFSLADDITSHYLSASA
ncbi:MAG: beta-lactamase family protein [Puniceicoccaceae bacterium]|nr:beta-lactamase family protein [Puniceicoccaceae bacterium]